MSKRTNNCLFVGYIIDEREYFHPADNINYAFSFIQTEKDDALWFMGDVDIRNEIIDLYRNIQPNHPFSFLVNQLTMLCSMPPNNHMRWSYSNSQWIKGDLYRNMEKYIAQYKHNYGSSVDVIIYSLRDKGLYASKNGKRFSKIV